MKRLLKIFRKEKRIPPLNRQEICVSGSGGQGIILAGIVLARAAVIDGKNAVQTQSYGPESRGGACWSEVIISEEEIDYPKTLSLDVLLAMQQEALERHIAKLKKEGILLIDSLLVKTVPSGKDDKNIFALPFTTIANNSLGNILVANMVALGGLVEITHLVSLESLKQSVVENVKEKFVDLNTKALLLGSQEANKLLETKKR